ncbi:GNAT family N-acetyltransferase [Ferrimonas pelagia]
MIRREFSLLADIMTLTHLLKGESIALSPTHSLNLLSPDDMPAICQMLADDRVNQYLFFAPAPEQIYYDYFTPQFAAMAASIAAGQQPNQLLLAIRDPQGQFAGMVAIVATAEQPNTYDIGYQLPHRSWGQGLASRACRLLTQLAFEQMGANKLQADTFDNNQASKRVLEKSGFGRTHKVYGHFAEGTIDQCWFGQTREQYQRSVAVANT